MVRLFGTDGIRGVANVDLKPTMAHDLGRATATRLAGPGRAIVVGQDTRRSGDMFVAAIVSGATSLGVDVHRVGVVPTPALAFLAGPGDFAAGIMVSASHNPAEDNGLKVLDAAGLKLDDDIEDELEQLIWRSGDLGGVGNAGLGRVDRRARTCSAAIATHRIRLARTCRPATCASSSTAPTAPAASSPPTSSRATGATVDVIHAEPDGLNINLDCGATDPASLAAAVVERGADIGFALDGDADRLRGRGRVRPGRGRRPAHRAARARPPGPGRARRRWRSSCRSCRTAASRAVIEAAGGQLIRTPVGDKYILEGMQVSGAVLGGEKSGHVIIREHSTSGDGVVTALEVLRVIGRIAAGRVERAGRRDPAAAPAATRRAARVTGTSGRGIRSSSGRSPRRTSGSAGTGRILVRPSGTEPALRVMVEGPDAELVGQLADEIATLAGERLN